MDSNPFIDKMSEREAAKVAPFNERIKAGAGLQAIQDEGSRLFTFFRIHPVQVLNDVLDWANELLDEPQRFEEIRYARVQEFFRRGMIDAIVEEYEKLTAFEPQNEQAWALRAGALFQVGRKEEALASATMAIQLNSGSVTAYINRGIILGEMEQYTAAIADFTKAIELNPAHAYGYSCRAGMQAMLHDLEAAFNDFTSAIEKDPQQAEFYFKRSFVLSELKQYDQAIADLHVAVSLEPDNLDYQSQLDLLSITRTKLESDAYHSSHLPEHYSEAMRFESLGYYYLQNSDSKKAKYYFKEAIQRNPTNLNMLANLMRLMFEDNEKKELINLCLGLLNHYIDTPVALYMIASLFLSLEELNTALAIIERAIQLVPENGEYYTIRGLIFAALGDETKSTDDLLKARHLGVVFDNDNTG